MPRCFLFKPDGIGDFFISTGAVRLMAREFGEENLVISVLPVLEPVVRGQFPKATLIALPILKKRVFLNLFVANCLRCFLPWRSLLGVRADVSISLRHMRDYLMNVLFYSTPAKRRIVMENLLLGNGRPVRRWTEKVFTRIFRPEILEYPDAEENVPRELEANRRLAVAALGRDVGIREIWPELRPVGESPIESPYWVCAPFANGEGKDFPTERWVEFLAALRERGLLPLLLLTGSGEQRARLEGFLGRIRNASPGMADDARVVIPANLQDFIDLLAGAGCVLTVDTAAAHAATALDCRTLVLFSGQHQGTYGPWVRSDRQCWILPKESDGGGPWHAAHTTGELLAAAEGILTGP